MRMIVVMLVPLVTEIRREIVFRRLADRRGCPGEQAEGKKRSPIGVNSLHHDSGGGFEVGKQSTVD
jgi:hypothetical protein